MTWRASQTLRGLWRTASCPIPMKWTKARSAKPVACAVSSIPQGTSGMKIAEEAQGHPNQRPAIRRRPALCGACSRGSGEPRIRSVRHGVSPVAAAMGGSRSRRERGMKSNALPTRRGSKRLSATCCRETRLASGGLCLCRPQVLRNHAARRHPARQRHPSLLRGGVREMTACLRSQQKQRRRRHGAHMT